MIAILSDITFFEVAASLVIVGIVERLFCMLPASAYGPGGWLLDTGTTPRD